MENIQQCQIQELRQQPGLSLRHLVAAGDLATQSSISKVDIQFGSMADKLRIGPNIVPCDNWTMSCDKEAKMPKMKHAENVKRTPSEGISYEKKCEADVNAGFEQQVQGPNVKPEVNAYNEDQTKVKANVKLAFDNGKRQKRPSVKTPIFKMDNSWKKSKDFYSIRYNMAFNHPSNQSLLSYDDAARTSRPKTAAFHYRDASSLPMNVPQKDALTESRSRSLCTLNPAISPRSQIESGHGSTRCNMKTQETKYKQNEISNKPKDGLWIKTESVVAPAENGCSVPNVVPREQNVHVVVNDCSLNDDDRNIDPTEASCNCLEVVQSIESPRSNRVSNVLLTPPIVQGDQSGSGVVSPRQINSNMSGGRSNSRKPGHLSGQGKQFTLMMFDSGVFSGDVCHPNHQRPMTRDKVAKQAMQRLTALSTGSTVRRSASTQPIKWSSSLLSRSWKSTESPKPPSCLLKCVPCDVGLEIVSETLVDTRSERRPITKDHRKMTSYQNCPHQNSRKQGGASSVLPFRAKSVTLPLHDLLQEQAYNTTMMSNYGRKRFLIPSSSMNLIEKEVAIPPRPMSEFAEAQLKKMAALKEAQKKVDNSKKPGPPPKPASKGISMFDEIKGLMKKSHSQSKEADNKIIKIPDEH